MASSHPHDACAAICTLLNETASIALHSLLLDYNTMGKRSRKESGCVAALAAAALHFHALIRHQ